VLHAGTLHAVTRVPASVPLAAAAAAPLELENKFALLAEMAGDDASASTPLRQASFPVSQVRARLGLRLRLRPTLTLTLPRSLTLIPNPPHQAERVTIFTTEGAHCAFRVSNRTALPIHVQMTSELPLAARFVRDGDESTTRPLTLTPQA